MLQSTLANIVGFISLIIIFPQLYNKVKKPNEYDNSILNVGIAVFIIYLVILYW